MHVHDAFSDDISGLASDPLRLVTSDGVVGLGDAVASGCTSVDIGVVSGVWELYHDPGAETPGLEVEDIGDAGVPGVDVGKVVSIYDVLTDALELELCEISVAEFSDPDSASQVCTILYSPGTSERRSRDDMVTTWQKGASYPLTSCHKILALPRGVSAGSESFCNG